MGYDIFISYSRKDIEIIDRIEEELKKYDITCFVDRSAIDLGDDFAEIIAKSLYECEMLLFIWSENSNQSENAANEIALAIDFEKAIIPFKIGAFKPHYNLAYRLIRFNRIDAIDFNEPQIIELGEKIAKRLGKTKVEKKKKVIHEEEKPVPNQNNIETNPLFETYYQLGKQALLKYNLDTAFSELLEPALHNYKDSQTLFSQIVRGNTRIWNIKEERFDYVLEKADEGNSFAQYLMSLYYGLIKNDPEKKFFYAKKSAEQESSFGIFRLAKCYDLGLGIPKNHNKYLQFCQKAISMNNAAALLDLAKNYLYGWSEKTDTERGLNILMKGVELEDPACLDLWGNICWEGEYVERDIEKAKELINKAISLGYIEGYKTLGWIYMYTPLTYELLDVDKGFDCFMKGAEYSEATCLSAVALCNDLGYAVKEDKKNALKWYIRAANAGHLIACYFIGNIYYQGEGIQEDNKLAWEWFSRGHKRINSNCSYMLGIMCSEGCAQENKTKKDAVYYFEESAFLGGFPGEESMLKLYDIYMEGDIVEKDENKALEWLKKAAELKNVTALLKYGIILTDMDSPYSNELKGKKYLQQALDKGNHEAALHLAKLYKHGIGTVKNIEKVKELLLIAAEQGNMAEAYCELGKYYSHIDHSDWEREDEDEKQTQEEIEQDKAKAKVYFEKAAEQDYTEAFVRLYELEWAKIGSEEENEVSLQKSFEWILKAAERDYPQALLDLGVSYHMGVGTSPDIDKAIEWYEKAYKQNNKYAPYNIAEIYHEGELLPKDLLEAQYWYREASKLNNDSAKEKLKDIEKEIENLYS